MENIWQQPVSLLKGIGPARAEALKKAGIETVEDAVRYYPRGYQNRGDIHLLNDESIQNDGFPHAFLLTVSSEPRVHKIRQNMTLLRFRAFDDTATVQITLFNQAYMKDTVHAGRMFRVYGKLEKNGGSLEISSPILETYSETTVLPNIVPVYPLSKGLSQKLVSRVVSDCLSLAETDSAEYLDTSLLSSEGLASEMFALRNIHFPSRFEDLLSARRRLTFDEIFLFTSASLYKNTPSTEGKAPALTVSDFGPLRALVPYELTSAQNRCVQEISHDLAQPVSTSRILTGDVGSGKTIVAAFAVFQALQNGFQAAFMAPTEILARQHYKDLKPLFSSLGYRVDLLTGSVPASRKKEIYQSLRDGTTSLVIGTHALLVEQVQFARLALVITDEQHRFGVHQREQLSQKNAFLHTLSMTATPIPRTLSLILFGTLSLSRLDEMPPGRQKVDTYVVNEDYRVRLDAFILKQVREGHQVYIVCPSIEDSPKEASFPDPEELTDLRFLPEPVPEMALKAAVSYAKNLQERLPSLRVGMVHGKMKSSEKDEIMTRFHEGQLDVLVSTTVIEVGVNVPAASLMIVENADRFGLSQLHQLRGRVGRGQAKSYCVLVSSSVSPDAKERLNTMKQCADGFEISEKDLKLRGPGDFFANSPVIRQSGEFSLPFAESCQEPAFMEKAATLARSCYEADPKYAAHPRLLERLNGLFFS